MTPAGEPVLEVYYSSACAPCRLELPDLAAFLTEGAGQLRIVILGNEARARDELTNVSSALETKAIAIEGKPRDILGAAGNPQGILPFARALWPDGAMCLSWRGRLSLEKARALIAGCRSE